MAESKVLIVEDDPIVLLIAAQTLRDAGFHVVEAETADEAATILAALAGGIDVVFTDVEMPGRLDGIALACMVGLTWPAVAVVVTSGRIRPAPSALPQAACFVGKPYDIGHVATLIGQLTAS